MNIDYSKGLLILVVGDVQDHLFLMSSGIELITPFAHIGIQRVHSIDRLMSRDDISVVEGLSV